MGQGQRYLFGTVFISKNVETKKISYSGHGIVNGIAGDELCKLMNNKTFYSLLTIEWE